MQNTTEKLIKGKLVAFYETGMEGILWAVLEPGKLFDGLNNIEEAKHLKVFRNGEVIWDKDIDFTKYSAIPYNTLDGILYKEKYWQFGIQKDINIDLWNQMFNEELEAELTI